MKLEKKIYQRDKPTKLWIGEIYKDGVVVYSAVHAFKYLVNRSIVKKMRELRKED